MCDLVLTAAVLISVQIEKGPPRRVIARVPPCNYLSARPWGHLNNVFI